MEKICYVGKATKIFIAVVTLVIIIGLVLGIVIHRRRDTDSGKYRQCSSGSCSQQTPLAFPSPNTDTFGGSSRNRPINSGQPRSSPPPSSDTHVPISPDLPPPTVNPSTPIGIPPSSPPDSYLEPPIWLYPPPSPPDSIIEPPPPPLTLFSPPPIPPDSILQPPPPPTLFSPPPMPPSASFSPPQIAPVEAVPPFPPPIEVPVTPGPVNNYIAS